MYDSNALPAANRTTVAAPPEEPSAPEHGVASRVGEDNELRRGQEQMRVAMTAAGLGLWFFYPEENRLLLDTEGRRLFGLSQEEEMTPDTMLGLVADHDLAAVQEGLSLGMSRERHYELEFEIVRPDGNRAFLSSRCRRIEDVVGHPACVIGVLSDLTERRAAEEARARYEAIYDTLFHSSSIGFGFYDPDLKFTRLNQSLASTVGVAPEFVLGRRLTDMAPAAAEAIEPFLRAALASEEPILDIELCVPAAGPRSGNPDESVAADRWCQMSLYRALMDDGQVLGAGLFAVDITRRRQAEAERARLLVVEQRARVQAEAASRAAEEANRAKDEFLATLSHELRTPLSAILGWVHMLRTASLDAATAEQGLHTIERNARTQAQLVEDVLDLSRIISGRLSLHCAPLEIEKVLRNALDAMLPAAAAKGIVLRQAIAANLGTMEGDATRLQQAVWNLISNAIKFTPPGGTVELLAAREAGELTIEVRDSGRGIASEFLPHVWDRFQQADSAGDRKAGLGLGLAIVRHLVELHGGTTSAFSAGEGLGATFTIRLPAREADVQPGASSASAPHAGAKPLAGRSLLVLEDDEDSRQVFEMVLRREGAQVQAVGSVAEAMHVLENWVPDAIISDIGLPNQDGYEFIRRVRELHGHLKSVPVIAMTAFARDQDRAQTLASGFDQHLAKPVEPEELVRTIVRLVA